jgi:hypothetical protein
LSIATRIGTLPINQRSCGADLKATTAGHASGFSKGDIHIGRDHSFGTPEFDSQRVIGGQLGTRSNTPAAEDATIVIHDEIFSRSIHGDFWVRILIEPVI